MKLAVLALASLVLTAPRPIQKDDPTLRRGRACCESFLAGDLDPLWDVLDEPLRQVFGGREGLTRFRELCRQQLGEPVALLHENAAAGDRGSTYVRRMRFEKAPKIEILVAFGPDRRVGGFLVRPAPEPAPSAFLDYATKTDLRLPFEGEWTVFWGGRTLEENYHASSRDQRFAYDLLIVRDGATHAGAGTRNEDYHCFGLPILAPAAGVVVSALDGVADNVPGETNRSGHAAGNHVVIDHGNGEHSLLAHFRQGSVRVRPGERVAPGAPLGLCGNSGNSSEPHLHVHLQNGPAFGEADGLPAQFRDYEADGVPVARGEPVKGQRVRPRAKEGG